MPSKSEIVISGLGVVSPIGIGSDAYWNNLIAGKSGIAKVDLGTGDDDQSDESYLAARVVDFEPKDYVKPRKAMKVMAREIQLGFSAAVLATQQAGVESGTVDPDRIGVVFGSELILSDFGEAFDAIQKSSDDAGRMQYERWGEVAMSNITPLWMLKSLPNMVACHVGIALDARGPNNTITTEETAALAAMIEAISVIRRGAADMMVVGAVGARSGPTRIIQRHADNFIDPKQLDEGICRPFDSRRSGAVPGESAGAIVIESADSAKRRGATPIAKITGYGNCFGKVGDSAGTIGTSGSAQSVQQSLNAAMSMMGCSAEEIGFVNAGANGAIALDASEANGIAESIVGNRPVNSFKAHVGESGAAGSLVDLIGTILSVHNGKAAATLNHALTGHDCPVNVISGQPIDLETQAALKTAITPHGHAVCIGISK